MKKYFYRVMFNNETFALMAKDGLIYQFDHSAIVPQLNNLFESDSGGWFFNGTHDRYCAEMFTDHVIVNPSIVSQLFGEPVLIGEEV